MRVLDQLHRLDVRALPLWERGAVRFLQFVQATWGQLHRDKVIIRASGLAYASLLAAVPLVAVAFALFSAFGAFDDVKQKVQDFLFTQFLPASQDDILEYFNQFAEGASKLGLIGFLFLVLASILLLDNIESNFNQIWHVTSRRRFVAKITSYTSVLTFGALLIGASITMSARIKAMLFRDVPFDPGTLEKLGTWVFPLLLTSMVILYETLEHVVYGHESIGTDFLVEVGIIGLLGPVLAALGMNWLMRNLDAQERAEAEIRRLNATLEQQVSERTLSLQQAYQELDEKNRKLQTLDQLKSEFVSVAAHELRTPLSAVIGYVEMLLDEDAGPLTDRQREFLEVVGKSGQRLLELTEDLLDLTRLDQVELGQGVGVEVSDAEHLQVLAHPIRDLDRLGLVLRHDLPLLEYGV